MNNKLEQYMIEKESLCEQRLNEAKLKVTQDWSVEDVKYVVKHLKKKKSRDSHGVSNELIQCGGDDLLLAITIQKVTNIPRMPRRM